MSWTGNPGHQLVWWMQPNRTGFHCDWSHYPRSSTNHFELRSQVCIPCLAVCWWDECLSCVRASREITFALFSVLQWNVGEGLNSPIAPVDFTPSIDLLDVMTDSSRAWPRARRKTTACLECQKRKQRVSTRSPCRRQDIHRFPTACIPPT